MGDDRIFEISFEKEDGASCLKWRVVDETHLLTAPPPKPLEQPPSRPRSSSGISSHSGSKSTKDTSRVLPARNAKNDGVSERCINSSRVDRAAISPGDTIAPISRDPLALEADTIQGEIPPPTSDRDQKLRPIPTLNKFEQRNKRFIETIESDEASRMKPQDALKNVIEYLRGRNKTNLEEDEKGAVYVFHDIGLQEAGIEMVKIGFVKSNNTPSERCTTINRECASNLKVFEAQLVDEVRLHTAFLLERVVQIDLLPHRVFHHCDCNNGTRHREYFQLPPDVALKTLDLWRRWLQREPSPFSRENNRWVLTAEWRQKLDKLNTNTLKSELNYEHEKRLEWWSSFFELPVSEGTQSCALVPTNDYHCPPAKRVLARVHDVYGSADDTSANEVTQGQNNTTPATGAVAESVKSAINFFASSRAVPQASPSPGLFSTPDRASKTTVKAEPRTPEFNFDDMTAQERVQQPSSQNLRDPSVHTKRERFLSPQKSPFERKLASKANTNHSSPLPDRLNQHGNNMAREAGTEENAILSSLDKFVCHLAHLLHQEQSAIPSRTVLQDLVQFRWPIISYFVLAISTPFLPHSLSVILWIAFLPIFMAELRGWRVLNI
ncbi:hypothetical protein K431DRAFT_71554 [Polychaeton citri CBS 116435]|uniref:Bacteriophage T5 Orf172 DNA-binding domain-containing protein n=1 Tax=Polychaeton citri CBS 116435 TaxID=1314669 RepID=A0A9P4UP75_9PEZI|nr:hypothetical protein K431DRAFT_71554 [Polychaeton citri CBS 116435]